MLVSELPFLRDYWYPVARSETLGDQPQAVRLLGEDYVVWRDQEGRAAVIGAVCPHRGGRLSGGWTDGGRVVCPYHGWQFAGSGRCVKMPQLDPGMPIPSRAAVAAAQVQERYGVIWASVSSDPHPLPVWPEADEGGWRLYVEFFEQWDASALRIIDNNLDQSHPAFVHRSTFGDPSQADLRPFALESTPDGFVSRYKNAPKGIGRQLGVTDDESQTFERVSEVELLAPLTTRTRFYVPSGPTYCFMGTATPVDDGHALYVRLTALSGSEAEQPFEMFHEFGTRVKEEDRVILEATLPSFPLETTAEVHIRTDRATIEYRRHLAKLHSHSQAHSQPQSPREDAVA